jgi:hypothetical protein
MYATYINNESLFIKCVNSCPATASISLLSSFSNNHDVKAIRESFCLHHVANAFIQDSFIIAIFGIGNHFEIHKFSTILYTSGLSFLVIALAPESQNIISFCKKNDIAHQAINHTITNGNISSVFSHHLLNLSTSQSVKNKDNTTQKIKSKLSGKRTNNITVFL